MKNIKLLLLIAILVASIGCVSTVVVDDEVVKGFTKCVSCGPDCKCSTCKVKAPVCEMKK